MIAMVNLNSCLNYINAQGTLGYYINAITLIAANKLIISGMLQGEPGPDGIAGLPGDVGPQVFLIFSCIS